MPELQHGVNLMNIYNKIPENLARIRKNLDPYPDITLIAITKQRTSTEIEILYQYGVKNFGENYLQEAQSKFTPPKHDLCLHFTGRLQTNKIRDIAALYDVVHTVPDITKATKLNDACTALGKVMPVFIQVDFTELPGRTGCAPNDIAALCENISKLAHLKLLGLMTLPAPEHNPESTFKKLKKLSELYTEGQCSMGMSDDYLLAAKCGATHVRIGSALFS